MTARLRGHLQSWQWTLRYRLAALSGPGKLLLLGCLLALGFMASGLTAYERWAGELQREVARLSGTTATTGDSAADRQRDLIATIQAFLPETSEADLIGAALHKAADETGLIIDKLGSQSTGSRSDTFRQHTLRVQTRGEKEKVERFILIALLDNDSLSFRRWAFQGDLTDPSSAGSTLDFELLVKP
ncbi:hypothetical protein D3C78_1329360 [compost metagenome]